MIKSKPDIIYSRPKLESIKTFLKRKGWKMTNKDKVFLYFSPPKGMKFPTNPDFQYRVPASEDLMDYGEWTFNLLESFSQLYDIELQDLFDVLSVDYQKIQRVFKQEAIEV